MHLSRSEKRIKLKEMFYLTKKPFKSLKIIEFQYLKCFEKIIWLWEGMGVGTGGGNKVIQLFSHSNFEKILTIFLPDIKFPSRSNKLLPSILLI